jgi:Uma2 family endonuclease
VLITPALVHAKVADYLAAGTKLVWVVDPQRRVVTTYRELLSPEVVADANVLHDEPLLPDFRLAVKDLFDFG